MNENKIIKVGLCGAAGRMGQALVKTLSEHPEKYQLVFAIGRQTGIGQDIATLSGLHRPNGVIVTNNLKHAIEQTKPDVVVELTHAQSVYANVETLLQHNIPCVVGASGINSAQIEELSKEAKTRNVSLLFAPNFALGVILMMKFAQEASAYFEQAEIVERHHDKKMDSPSGTALHTASLMGKKRQTFKTPQTEKELLEGARGAKSSHGIPIHSLRLVGSLAHQEVIFGGTGETLTIKHDTLNREAFMGGVLLAIDTLIKKPGIYHGLEEIL